MCSVHTRTGIDRRESGHFRKFCGVFISASRAIMIKNCIECKSDFDIPKKQLFCCKKCRDTFAARRRSGKDVRHHRLLSRYKITQYDLNQMLTAQHNACALCSKRFDVKMKAVIDHCHKSGKVRGILCHRCNMMLGCFADDPNIVQKAIEYIRVKKQKRPA